MGKPVEISKPEQRTPLAQTGLNAVTPAFVDTLDRSTAFISRSALHWQAETARSVNDLNVQSEAMLVRLFSSKTPLDVLSAQHDWLRARSRSLFEAGLRWADAWAEAASAEKENVGEATASLVEAEAARAPQHRPRAQALAVADNP